MTTSELHHEITRALRALSRIRVHPEDEFLRTQHLANIEDATNQLRRVSESNQRAGQAGRGKRHYRPVSEGSPIFREVCE